MFTPFRMLAGVVLAAAVPALAQGPGGNAAAQAARAEQLALEARLPRLRVTETILPLRVPGHTIGETEGVSMNSKGHLFVYSRTGATGSARGSTAAQLFEFDPQLRFVKLWGPDNYAASFAHAVRVDRDDHVWMIDEGSNMLVDFSPNGDVARVFGRKPESIDWFEKFAERGEKDTVEHPVGSTGTFNRPADIAWSPAGDGFIADGYGNSRVVKIGRDGSWLKSVGTFGSGRDQFNTVHSIATDADGNVYVADRGNRRIQVYDYELNYKATITGMGAPWAVQVTPKYIYSGDGNGKLYRFDRKTFRPLGWVQTGLGQGQTQCLIHELHAVSDTVLYRGSCSMWNVSKIVFQD